MKKLIYSIIILMCVTNTLDAQTIITLNQPEAANGNVDHVANTAVNFQTGYHYSPLTATSIHAYINESVTGNTPAGGVFSGGLGGGFDDRQINTGLEVGTISGNHGVSPSGGATYSIPIKLPPGTNGKAPSLSINYNSQQGNGLLGMGWNLGGLSVITRVPKTIYHNSIVEPVMIDNYDIPSLGTLSDDFAIDGNRLINTNGNYGADGTVYGTENETFNKITSFGVTGDGPAWFKVETKDGLTLEYGNTPDSKMLPTVQKTSVMFWYLNKVVDNYGNIYNYSYRLEDNELLVDKIEYGNSQETFNSIQFIYDSRQDKNTIHVATEPVNQNVVLSQIKISADGVLARKYELKYGFNVFTFLTEIIEYGSDGTNLNSTIFKYGDVINDASVEPIISSLKPSNLQSTKHEFYTSDFNGDGKSDLFGFSYEIASNYPNVGSTRFWMEMDLYINDGNNEYINTASISLPNGFSSIDQFYPNKKGQIGIGNASIQHIDFNGDGFDDILFIIPDENNNQIIHPYLFNGTTFLEQTSIIIPTAGSFFSRTFDADGDGKTEIFIAYNTSSTTFKYQLIFNLSLSDPKSTASVKTYSAIFHSVIVGYSQAQPNPNDYPPINCQPCDPWGGGCYGSIFYTDGNGTGWSCFENPGYQAAVTNWNIGLYNGTIYPITSNGSFQGFEYDFSESYIMDHDGDGKYEIDNVVRMYPNTNGVEKKIVLDYNGTGFSDIEHQPSIPYQSITSLNDQLFGDFNGDRISDKIYTHPSNPWVGWTYRYSNSTSFIESNTYTQLLSPYESPYGTTALRGIHYVADVNGDGKSDIVEFESGTTINVHYSNGVSFVKKSFQLTTPIDLNYDELLFGDYNGDGKTDVMIYARGIPYFSNNYRIVYFEKDSKELLLHGIKDGFNNTTEFAYDYLTNDDIYTKGSSSNYPLVDVQIASPVVTEVKTDNGVGGNNITTYRYEEAIMYKQGRGLLGFKKTISENNTSNTRTVMEYGIDNTFIIPYLKKINTALISPSQPLSETEYFYDYSSLVNKQFLKTTSQIIQKNLLNNFITTTNYSTYDDYGNVELTTIDKGGIETITINDLYESHGNWGAKNRLSSNITSVSRPSSGTPPYVRETTFEYYTEGSLKLKIEDPSTPKTVTTTYDYNPFGNMKETTVSGAGVSTRINEFIYDSKGRFVVETINPLQQHSFATYDNRWGVPLTQTGVDGLTTTYQYDGFGRLIKTTTPDNISTETTLAWEIGGGGASNPLSADNSIYTSTTTSTQSPTTKVWYDSFGRPRKNEVDGFDQKINQVTTYDARGNVATTTTPFFAADAPKITTYSYDDYNMNNSITNDVSTTTINRNLITGTTTTTLTPSNGGSPTTSTSVTDPTGKIISVTDAGGTLTYTYYSSGLQKDIKLDGVLVADMEYDIKGNQTRLTDANAGVTTYEYNPFGELTKQTDAKNNIYEMTYDVMGRIETKTENGNANFTTNYEYYDMGDNGVNQIKNITYNGITQEFTYDYLGRLVQNKETIGTDEYKFGYVYDTYNRLEQTTYPSGFITKHHYNNLSYPTSVTDEQANPIWQVGSANVMNAYNQYKTYVLGNGQTTTKTYNDYGFIESTSTSNPDIQNLVLNFNPANGNLMSRERLTTGTRIGVLEEFTYDNLNRLTETKVNGTVQLSTEYQTNGNIGFKTDAGNYSYHVNKKNAVTQVSNPIGNIGSNVQDITYTPFNSVNSIIEDNKTLTFTYGSDQQRRKMQYLNNSILERTNYYIGNYEKIVNETNGDVTELHYIAGGDGLAAIHVITKPNNQQPTASTFYTYTDHLGSILTLTDENANLVYEQNFDAWGRERNADTWEYVDATATGSLIGFEWLARGYTGHEHLPEFGLINMNGRMYDPILGRMLSPDNYVQSPFNTQSYNRYSYVINNPLKYIDQSGENWWSDFWGGVGDAWNGFWDFLNGTYNPATGQNEGGLAQQVPSWVPDFSVGVNSSGQTFHTVGNSGPIYHNNNSYTIPGINFSEVYVPNNSSVGGMPTTGVYGEQLNLGGFQPSLDEQGGGVEFGSASLISGGVGVVGDAMSMSNSTFRLTGGANWAFSPKIYSSGWKGGSPAKITTYSLSKVGSGVSTGGNLVGTGIAYYQIADGSAQPITYVDAGLGTMGIIASGASYFYGVQIPFVGGAVAVYGVTRITWDVFYNLGSNYGPSKWYGTDDRRWFK